MLSSFYKTLLIGSFLTVLLGNTAAVVNADTLAGLATVVDRTSHRASSFDRTGGNGDNIKALAPGETHVMLDTGGPGKIGHIWITVSSYSKHETFLRDLVVRIYWEGSKVPSVEVPLGDFFGLGHGKQYKVCSSPVCVGASDRALNCYWPMPFYKHARVEIYNNGRRSIRRIYYNVDYDLGKIAPDQALFHAEFRRVKDLAPKPFTKDGKDNFVILDTKGEGQYVGCFFFVDSAPGGWWGEGDEMIFIDGAKMPTITGTGTEDYFCNAWGFAETFCYPYYGVPLLDKKKSPDKWSQTTAYRFHIPSPIRFKKSIRVTMEHHWGGKATYDYSCVAYWYQKSPNRVREPLPVGEKNWPRDHQKKTASKKPVSLKLCGTEFEASLRAKGVAVKAITLGYQDSFKGAVLRVDPKGQPVEITTPVVAAGRYRVKVRLHEIVPNKLIVVGPKEAKEKLVVYIEKKGGTADLGVV